MTCIIGYIGDDGIYMGGDSAHVSGWDVRVGGERKIFRFGDMLIGCSGPLRAAQLIRYHLVVPDQPADMDEMTYMVTRFVPALRETFKEHGSAEVTNGKESQDNTILVAYRRRLFPIEGNFQIASCGDEPYTAIGVGEQYALGAMEALRHERPPQEAIYKALEITAHFCIGVAGPFYIESLEANE